MEKEIFYLLGAFRDANFDVREKKNYELRIYQKDENWLRKIENILTKNFCVRARIKNKMLRMNNKEIVEKLLRISEYKCPQKLWKTPSIVKKATREEIWCYVSGFWDSEGGLPLKPECTNQKYVSFDQKSKEALNFVREFLFSENLKPTRLTYTSKVWQFRLTRRNSIIEFASKIHSIHPTKSERLSRLVISFP